MKTLLLVLLLLSGPRNFIGNFDKEVSFEDSWIIIAPPAGKTWTISRGAFNFGTQVVHTWVWVFIEDSPGDPMHRVGIARVDTSAFEFVPIVGEYMARGDGTILRGSDRPIELIHPQRIVIAVTGLDSGARIQTYTRAAIKETDSKRGK